MSRTRIIAALAVAAALGGLSQGRAEAGWLMVDQGGGSTLVSEGRMKAQMGAGSMIMDAKKGELLFLDNTGKTYCRTDTRSFCGALTAMFDEMMKGMPPEQRQMMEQMMGGGASDKPIKVAVKDDGPGGKMLGFDTQKYSVSVDGALTQELWIAADPGLRKEFGDLATQSNELNGCTKSLHNKNIVEAAAEYVALMAKGLPMKMVSHDKATGAAQPTMELTKLEKQDVPESEFKVPEGYKEITVQAFTAGMMGGGGGGGNPHGGGDPH